MLDSGSSSVEGNRGPVQVPAGKVDAKKTQLAELAKNMRKALDSAGNGPLIQAKPMMEILANWSEYKAAADGMSAGAWLHASFGPSYNVKWFERRANAVDRIGEHARRAWDHNAAAWASDNIKDEADLKKLNRAVMERWAEQGRVLLTIGRVQRVALELGIRVPREKTASGACALCEEKDKTIAELRARLGDNGAALSGVTIQ